MTATIIEAALRALLLAAAVGLGLRLLGLQNVPARKAVWSFVLLPDCAVWVGNSRFALFLLPNRRRTPWPRSQRFSPGQCAILKMRLARWPSHQQTMPQRPAAYRFLHPRRSRQLVPRGAGRLPGA